MNKWLYAVIDAIMHWNFEWLDIKKLAWEKEVMRCRLWNLRIVFKKEWNSYAIIDIWTRWDIYN